MGERSVPRATEGIDYVSYSGGTLCPQSHRETKATDQTLRTDDRANWALSRNGSGTSWPKLGGPNIRNSGLAADSHSVLWGSEWPLGDSTTLGVFVSDTPL